MWTYRGGSKLKEAVDFCSKNGLTFYAVNKSYPEEVMNDSISRKIHADIFIDDRDIHGMMGWGEIYQILGREKNIPPSLKYKRKKQKKKPSKGFIGRIEDLFKE